MIQHLRQIRHLPHLFDTRRAAASSPVSILRSALAAWYDASRPNILWADPAGTTPATTVVGKWDDISGNGRHLINGGATDRPSLLGSAITFDGVNDLLSVTFALPQPADFFIVWKTTGALGINAGFVGDSASNTAIYEHNTAPTKVTMFAGSLAPGTQNRVDGTPVQQRCLFNGASSVNQNNRGTADTVNPGAAGFSGILLGDNSGVFCPFTIYELIVANAASTAAQVTAIQNYLLAKWGV